MCSGESNFQDEKSDDNLRRARCFAWRELVRFAADVSAIWPGLPFDVELNCFPNQAQPRLPHKMLGCEIRKPNGW